MNTTQLFADLSENERVIRTYQCTKIRRLFSKPSIGYLSVTNKRVVYHSQAKSGVNDSAVISEIPLQDVGGIASTIGNSFNMIYFLLASAGLFLFTTILTGLLPTFLTGWAVSIILTLPYLIGLLFEKNIISPEIGEKIIRNMEGTSVESIIKKSNAEIVMKILRIMFLVGMPLFAWNISQEIPVFGFIILIAAYFLVYMFVFGRMRSFDLSVNSKSAGHAGIMIHGNAFLALFNPTNTAAKTMSAAPTQEAETVVRELGAMVLDIQQMGDLGIEKWSSI